MHSAKTSSRSVRGALVFLAFLTLATACDGASPRDGWVRLVDVWIEPDDVAAESHSLTYANVTRTGILIARDLTEERFEFRVPRAGVLRAWLGVVPIVGAIPDPAARVDFAAAPCPTRRDARREPPLGRFELEGFGWHPVEIDLGAYSKSEIALCLSASSGADVALLLSDAAVVSTEGEPARSDRPNLLLITLDTMRGDHLGSAGYPRDVSPFLDALASEGEQYLNAITNSAWTLPSHASLFTGLHPREHGARSHILGTSTQLWNFFGLADARETLAERLWEVGYRTGGIVAGTMVNAEFGFSQGFDLYDQLPKSAPADALDAEIYGQRDAEDVTDLALAWLDDPRRPFFLFLNYFDPHWPYDPPDDLAAEWLDADAVEIDRDEYLTIWREVMTDARDLSDEERRSMVALYDAEIRAMDRAIGRLFEGLKASGEWERTMVVVVSDHGEAFGEHRTIDHGVSLYEEQLRSALIVKYPSGVHADRVGAKFEHRVDLLDLHASILREFGLEGVETESAPSATVGLGLDRMRDTHFAELNRNPWTMGNYGKRFDRDLEVVYRGRFKLIRTDRGGLELYDLESDPEELKNLATTETATLAELVGELDAFGRRAPWQAFEGEAVPLSSELSEQLEALGYGEKGRDARASGEAESTSGKADD